MAWIYVLIAGLFEMCWPFILKIYSGNVKWIPYTLPLFFGLPCTLLLAQAVKSLPASTVYAGFVGIGAIGTTLIGVFVFQENASPARMVSMALLIVGLIGLKVFDSP